MSVRFTSDLQCAVKRPVSQNQCFVDCLAAQLSPIICHSRQLHNSLACCQLTRPLAPAVRCRYQKLASQLLDLMRVQTLDDILPAVREVLAMLHERR